MSPAHTHAHTHTHTHTLQTIPATAFQNTPAVDLLQPFLVPDSNSGDLSFPLEVCFCYRCCERDKERDNETGRPGDTERCAILPLLQQRHRDTETQRERQREVGYTTAAVRETERQREVCYTTAVVQLGRSRHAMLSVLRPSTCSVRTPLSYCAPLITAPRDTYGNNSYAKLNVSISAISIAMHL